MDEDIDEDLAERITQPLTPAAVPTQIRDDSQLWGLLIWIDKPELDAIKLEKSRSSYTVGRHHENDVVLNLNKFQNREFLANISRIHFKIRLVEDKTGIFVYVDDFSANGTFINGLLVGKGNTRVVNHGDDISVKKSPLFTYVSFGHKHLDYPAEVTQSYLIIKTIGKGAYGEVAMAFSRSNGKCAIKSVLNQHIHVSQNQPTKHDALNQIRHEANILRSLQHPCIVKVEDIIYTSKTVYLILEFMEGGTLNERLSEKTQMAESQAKFYFMQLALAVQYCHEKGIAHRDLKPENILLSSRDDDAILKVSDFGLSKLMDAGTLMKTYCGTPRFVAPEVIEAARTPTVYTSSCDIWSMGVILFIMLAGYFPFKESKNRRTLEKQIILGLVKYRSGRWSSISSKGYDLVNKMLKTNPEKRLTIGEVLEHSWMQDSDVIHRVKTLAFSKDYATLFPVHHVKFADDEMPSLPKKRRRVT